MQTVASEQVIFVDVDSTLIMWTRPIKRGQKTIAFTDPYDNSQHIVVPHSAHIKVLKDRKARGATIIVWSQSGYKWAEAVVKALKLENYVDQVMSKPVAYIDDLPVQEWMAERIYLDPASHYGA